MSWDPLEESNGYDGGVGGFLLRSMCGRGTGVPSNSAHPPRRPISTTRCNIRANSSCLCSNKGYSVDQQGEACVE